MTRLVFVTLLLAISAPRTASAQIVAPRALRANDNPRAFVAQLQPTAVRRSAYEIPGRMVLGVGGAVVGAMGGALIGANLVYQGGCACEDPGLGEAITGAAIGSVLGSAVFAAIPSFNSSCGAAERIGLGVGGALLGALAGGVVGVAAGGGGVLFGYMGGAGIGAGLIASACKE